IEAMAAEVPVIGSEVRGLSSTIGEAGILFEHQNAKELAKKIEKLLSTDSVYKSCVVKGLKKSLQYDLSEKSQQHILLYSK
ncbi:MAG: glycosyltransferase, partial [Culicoidibacterales bacterium]